MEYYESSTLEHKEWCVPSTLQMLLKSRGIEISQSEIAPCFDPVMIDFSFQGFIFNNKSLQNLLKKFNLKSEFRNPHESVEFYEECDLFLREAVNRGDVILGYDLPSIQKRENGLRGHVSLIKEFDFISRTITTIDPVLGEKNFTLGEFIVNMDPWKNKNYGFYVVGE